MAYYSSDRIERRNRRKAIVITTVLYLSLFSLFLIKDEVAWREYLPVGVQALFGEAPNGSPAVANVEEARP
ncbi:MAG: hypothetical protein DA408_10305 [Bacteroidetes bacterium]|nr:MAG: hypothetical protein C7N36_16205 [Bacteroidota bacterium]PTM12561.1 MAG: hypothetical protein DA408_10305 [Bacteroidota bacterium]